MRPPVLRQNVGIDISKDDFKVCVYELQASHRKRIKASRTFKNKVTGFKDFLKWFTPKHQSDLTWSVTLEATGVYYEQLVHYLDKESDSVIHVVLPNMAKAYSKSLGIDSKTDKIDAKMLGLLGLERELQVWQPLSANMFILKQLTRDRVSMVEEKTALSNKLHALQHAYQAHKSAIKRLQTRLKLLVKQIKQVEKEIAQLVDTDKSLKERIEKVCSVKGLGLITVATIVAETDGFELFTSRSQLTSYAGYDVVHRESGTSLKGKTRISKRVIDTFDEHYIFLQLRWLNMKKFLSSCINVFMIEQL